MFEVSAVIRREHPFLDLSKEKESIYVLFKKLTPPLVMNNFGKTNGVGIFITATGVITHGGS
jgi:hypothetical protein